ncbi:hypothetical protein TNCV_4726111 [Trichonephila clavipes]|nr:hypothetical protein TNCV_4726111 [Trichonephila clavipes]
MDEQLKALLEGINALKNVIGNVEKRQELRNILEKKIEQAEERYERVAGNFSLISQRVEDFENKLLACGNAANESKPRKSAPTELTDDEDMITYAVEEEELEPDPAGKFTIKEDPLNFPK